MSEKPKAEAEAELNPAGRAIEAQAEIIEEAIGVLSSVVNRWHHGVDVTVADWSDVARFARVADAATKLVKKIREKEQHRDCRDCSHNGRDQAAEEDG